MGVLHWRWTQKPFSDFFDDKYDFKPPDWWSLVAFVVSTVSNHLWPMSLLLAYKLQFYTPIQRTKNRFQHCGSKISLGSFFLKRLSALRVLPDLFYWQCSFILKFPLSLGEGLTFSLCQLTEMCVTTKMCHFSSPAGSVAQKTNSWAQRYF